MTAKRNPKQPRLAPGAIADELFCLDPDRDERAPQLCAETLLTLVQNGYRTPSEGRLTSPKRQMFALRSLALGENFLGGRDDGRAGDERDDSRRVRRLVSQAWSRCASSHTSPHGSSLMQGLIDPADPKRPGQPAWCMAATALPRVAALVRRAQS